MPSKTKAPRPDHLRVMGTHLSTDTSKNEMMALLSAVPLEWNFDTDGGKEFLQRMHSRVKEGTPVEVIADEVGLGEDLVDIYNGWAKDRV